MIKAIGMGEYLTPDVKEMLDKKKSIVKVIKLTCDAFPEQYECFDEYGWQVGYLRLRYGVFTVHCPDCLNTMVYEDELSGAIGYGIFDTEVRCGELSNAIDAIDNYFSELKSIEFVREYENGWRDYKIKGDKDCMSSDIMEPLYEYQQSNFTPKEVMEIRKKGPSLTYKEAILKVLRDHRLVNSSRFPEANGRDGLSQEHIENEIPHFEKNMNVIVINSLFGKTFDDFLVIFREYSTKGLNAL